MTAVVESVRVGTRTAFYTQLLSHHCRVWKTTNNATDYFKHTIKHLVDFEIELACK